MGRIGKKKKANEWRRGAHALQVPFPQQIWNLDLHWNLVVRGCGMHAVNSAFHWKEKFLGIALIWAWSDLAWYRGCMFYHRNEIIISSRSSGVSTWYSD
jgi:hypothetical protein